MTDASPLATLDADEALTAGLARALAPLLRPGDTLLLDGPVGAGKTHFARALIRARQGDAAEDVPSPTFTLVQTYADAEGVELWHADLYRLADASELVELGLDEALADSVTLIEWPDRMGTPPPGALTVSLAPLTPDTRRITLSGDPARWTGVARTAQIASFLHRAGWDDARLSPLAGDASARRYFRLTGNGTTAVLMDDPAGSAPRYLAMTGWLRDRGFHAPAVLAEDADAGLVLLDDLGDALLARVLNQSPQLTDAAYDRVTDLIAELHRHAPPDFAPALDGPALAEQVGLFAQWYPPAAGAPGAGSEVGAVIAALHRTLCADAAPVVSLRDFHAENLIWRGDAPLGLLDFQDAVATHPAYELASALQDARRDISPALEQRQIDRYVAATGAHPDRFRAAYALLGAQRGLRIMGIFTRLCLQDAKPRYLDFMPRVWAAIRRDVAHPALAELAAALDGVPAPTPQVIAAIRARCGTAGQAPDRMMLFAAGKGTRMAPLTDTLPKPLIVVGGQTLLDRALDLARAGGVQAVTVNTHHLGEQIVRHLAGTGTAISDESDHLLETGGGLRKALPLLGDRPVVTMNPDVVWRGANPVAALRAAWDDGRMDALLMLVPADRARGRVGGGDFALGPQGRLIRGGALVYGGTQIIRTDRLAEIPEQVFSLNRLWDLMIAEGRAFGLVHPGDWCDVGRPDCIALAEAMLAE